MVLERFFARSGKYPAYAMYEIEHFIMLLVCAIGIIVALFRSRKMNKEQILKRIKKCAILLLVSEILSIIFNFFIGNGNKPNTYIPLYYCSLTIYCIILSGYGKGKAKRLGDIFLTVGGIVGGVAYLICPSTTAGFYPIFHCLSFYSFIYHSIMVYFGLLFIWKNYVNLKVKDVVYYASTIIITSIVAYVVNSFLGSNLMFVSQNHPGTAVELIYKISPTLFPILITFIQAVPPFFVIFAVEKIYKYIKKKIEN